MRDSLQNLIDVTIGNHAPLLDHPQPLSPYAVQRERGFEANRQKLVALRQLRVRRQIQESPRHNAEAEE